MPIAVLKIGREPYADKPHVRYSLDKPLLRHFYTFFHATPFHVTIFHVAVLYVTSIASPIFYVLPSLQFFTVT
jgi:hypothetical protein